MATDYDAPRRADPVGGDTDEVIGEIRQHRAERQSGTLDVDDADVDEPVELAGADLSGLTADELTIRVLPRQHDEFVCAVCFLVHHHTRRARHITGRVLCRDCA